MKKIYASPYVNYANPYTEEFYRLFGDFDYDVIEYDYDVVKKDRKQIVHYHWPEYQIFRGQMLKTIFGALKFYFCLFYLRFIRGHRLVWTCHNVLPHGIGKLKAVILLQPLCWFVHQVIYLSEENRQLAEGSFPILVRKQHCVIRLALCEITSTSTSALPKTHLCFFTFGLIKPYKGVDLLMRSFDQWSRNSEVDATLKIVGACPDKTHLAELKKLSSNNSRIDPEFNFITEEQLTEELDSAAVAIFAFRRVVNSSSALRALSQKRRVIAPRMGSLIELQNDFGEQLVFLFDELSESTFHEIVEWLKQDVKFVHPDIYDPKVITKQVVNFLNSF